ncbi:hypothetical protein ACWF7H_05715 [Peribacillus butanolivorans]
MAAFVVYFSLCLPNRKIANPSNLPAGRTREQYGKLVMIGEGVNDL